MRKPLFSDSHKAICACTGAGRFTRPGNRRGLFFPGKFSFILAFLFVFSAFVWAVPMQQVSYGEQGVAREYELKAVYLYNFLNFVQWPESRKPLSKDGTMVIGVVGDSPFGRAFEELQADIRKSRMKPVKVVDFGPYRSGMDLTNCHILFVSDSERKNFAKIVAGLGGAPVLTVADREDFLSSGGMINLVKSEGKIRWVINRAQAEKAGLRFSVQLLTLALSVEGN